MVFFRKTKKTSETEIVVELMIVRGRNEVGDEPGKKFPLQRGNNYIGRDPLCEVVLNSGTVSRKHANLKVSYNKRSFTILDLGGVNGIILKPQTVLKKSKSPLNPGDEFQIGGVVLKLVVSDEDDSHKTMMSDTFIDLMNQDEPETLKMEPEE